MSAPLKLIALDEEDLTVISAHVQDGLVKPANIAFDQSAKVLALEFNRFAWEAPPVRGVFSKTYERRRSILHFSGIRSVRTHKIDRQDETSVLSILSVTYHAEPDDAAGLLTVQFSDDAAIEAAADCIEARLSDQGPAWAASARPRHKA